MSDLSTGQLEQALKARGFTEDVVRALLGMSNSKEKQNDQSKEDKSASAQDQIAFEPGVYLQASRDKGEILKVLEGFGSSSYETELELASRKFPYRENTPKKRVLVKTTVKTANAQEIVGTEVSTKVDADDKDTVAETESKKKSISEARIAQTTQTDSDYQPKKFKPGDQFEFYRDDLTDQKNVMLDAVKAQEIMDEFTEAGTRIYDKATENPSMFGLEDAVSLYEADKPKMVEYLGAVKNNVITAENILNSVENKSSKALSGAGLRKTFPTDSMACELACRELRETLIRWYDDKPGKSLSRNFNDNQLCGTPKEIAKDILNEKYEWFDNTVAGLEDSAERLAEIETYLGNLVSEESLNALLRQLSVTSNKTNDQENGVVFTREVIDQTMAEKLGLVAKKSEGKTTPNGKLTQIKTLLGELRSEYANMLSAARTASSSQKGAAEVAKFKSTLKEMVSAVNQDCILLTNLVQDSRQAFKLPYWEYEVPSTVEISLGDVLGKIVSAMAKDLSDLFAAQNRLSKKGMYSLDSMLNKIGEMNNLGPACDIPFQYKTAIDSVNHADQIYSEIWTDMFNAWHREFTLRLWLNLNELINQYLIHRHLYPDPSYSGAPITLPTLNVGMIPEYMLYLQDAVPLDYRETEIKELFDGCRNRMHRLCYQIVSSLYAIGTRRTQLAAVVNDSSLNGSDESVKELEKVAALVADNARIMSKMALTAALYDDPRLFVPKNTFDKEVAAEELSPDRESNQTILNGK